MDGDVDGKEQRVRENGCWACWRAGRIQGFSAGCFAVEPAWSKGQRAVVIGWSAGLLECLANDSCCSLWADEHE